MLNTRNMDSTKQSHALLKRHPGRTPAELFIRLVLFLLSAISILTTLAVIGVLAKEVLGFFSKVPLVEFLSSTEWTPLFSDPHYGILPLLSGTLWVTLIALCVSLPLGIGAAIYLSEYAPTKMRFWIMGILEVLGGIPTVVFGYFALLFITPLLQKVIPGLQLFNPISAGLVLGFAILPYISNIAADAMQAVPKAMREAAYGLGATQLEVTLKVVVPASISGIVAAFILATSRAIGETMIVALAAGQRPIWTFDPRETIATMTSYIVQAATGDQAAGSIASQALFAVGATLFVLTLGLNLVAQRVVRRYQEKYE